MSQRLLRISLQKFRKCQVCVAIPVHNISSQTMKAFQLVHKFHWTTPLRTQVSSDYSLPDTSFIGLLPSGLKFHRTSPLWTQVSSDYSPLDTSFIGLLPSRHMTF